MVDKDLSKEVFNLIKAIVDHNHNQVANIYLDLTKNTKDAAGILGMINSSFIDMLKITKFAKKYWYLMLMIFALLGVQAFCELSLPQYTANIVDVGIQYGDIIWLKTQKVLKLLI